MAASSPRLSFCRALRGGPVRPDQQGQLGEELGQVQAQLQVAGRHVAVARLEQHDLCRRCRRRGRRRRCSGRRPEPGSRSPPPRWPSLVSRMRSAVSARCVTRAACSRSTTSQTCRELRVGRRRAASSARVVPSWLSLASTAASGPTLISARSRGVGTPASSRRVGQQGPPLDGPLDGERRAARYLRRQPQPAVQPVERVRRLLVAVEDGDVQPAAASQGRGVPAGLRAGVPDPAHADDRRRRRR